MSLDNGDRTTVKELIRAIMDERDIRYEQRFKAQEAALNKAEESRTRAAESLRAGWLWAVGVMALVMALYAALKP